MYSYSRISNIIVVDAKSQKCLKERRARLGSECSLTGEGSFTERIHIPIANSAGGFEKCALAILSLIFYTHVGVGSDCLTKGQRSDDDENLFN